MSYRAPGVSRRRAGDITGKDVAQGIQMAQGFATNPIGTAVSFLAQQVLGAIFGEDTHLMYLRWLQGEQEREAAGAKKSAVAKRSVSRTAFYAGRDATARVRSTLLRRLLAARRRSR